MTTKISTNAQFTTVCILISIKAYVSTNSCITPELHCISILKTQIVSIMEKHSDKFLIRDIIKLILPSIVILLKQNIDLIHYLSTPSCIYRNICNALNANLRITISTRDNSLDIGLNMEFMSLIVSRCYNQV